MTFITVRWVYLKLSWIRCTMNVHFISPPLANVVNLNGRHSWRCYRVHMFYVVSCFKIHIFLYTTRLTSSHLINFSPSWSALETSIGFEFTASVVVDDVCRGLCWFGFGRSCWMVDWSADAVAVVSADAAILLFRSGFWLLSTYDSYEVGSIANPKKNWDWYFIWQVRIPNESLWCCRTNSLHSYFLRSLRHSISSENN